MIPSTKLPYKPRQRQFDFHAAARMRIEKRMTVQAIADHFGVGTAAMSRALKVAAKERFAEGNAEAKVGLSRYTNDNNNEGEMK